MNFINDSILKLKEAGYKMTGPRMAVLHVFEKANIPLSAYDIEERIPENIPVNVVTIYRVLSVFEKLGITHRIHTKEGYVRCDFEDKAGCHYFAICSECGRADEFIQDQCEMESIIPKNLPYKSLSHLSEMSGVCNTCALTTKK